MKYRFQALDIGENKKLLRYDNADDRNKVGAKHHRHLRTGEIRPIQNPFRGEKIGDRRDAKKAAEKLFERFMEEVKTRHGI